ncbi:MAG: hypothetical protein IPL14_19490 [Nitrospira sp.]|nr:hypothetical protein [Nitrospira sp.]
MRYHQQLRWGVSMVLGYWALWALVGLLTLCIQAEKGKRTNATSITIKRGFEISQV